jgi:isopentenyldiphosphate isomerase
MSDLFVEVNDKDKIVGALEESSFFGSDRLHRSSAVLILNDEGEILLQRRKKDCAHYPGLLDFPVNAWVKKGESYEECLTRAMRESLGLGVHFVEAVSYLSPKADDQSFVTLFTTYTEGPFRLLSPEMETVEWMTIKWLKDDLERRPDKFTPLFVEGIRLYFEKFGEQQNTLDSII